MSPGDAEELLVAALNAKQAVTNLCGGRIATLLHGTYPAIRISLVGGPPRPADHTAAPTLQAECWADGSGSAAQDQAAKLARAVEEAALSLAGTYPAGTIVGSWTEGYIIHSADAQTSRERYIVQIGLLTQP